MDLYNNLMKRLDIGDLVIIDGATGTEIERRGVPQLDNAWNGGGALSHPHILREVHQDYIRSGADIIISNTFATLKSALRDAGVEKDFDIYNRRAVTLASEARMILGADSVLVAGGISHWSWSGRHPSLSELSENAHRQAVIMVEAGADLMMLEMMTDIDRMLAVLDGIEECGLPVWVGFSCEIDSGGVVRLLDGATLSSGIKAIIDRDVPLISIMHTEVADIDYCLDVIEKVWSGYVGVYAHSGDYVEGKWIFDSVVSPADYVAAADKWIERGVQLIGGCCGIGPTHIRSLKEHARLCSNSLVLE